MIDIKLKSSQCDNVKVKKVKTEKGYKWVFYDFQTAQNIKLKLGSEVMPLYEQCTKCMHYTPKLPIKCNAYHKFLTAPFIECREFKKKGRLDE